MDALALLQVENACKDVVLAAADAVDQQQYEAFVALFAEDATLTRPGGAALQGHADILAAYRSKDSQRLTHHLICNHRVTVLSPTLAESQCKVLLYATDKRREATPQGREADPGHQIGTIMDRLTLTDKGWKIQNRQAWFDLRVHA